MAKTQETENHRNYFQTKSQEDEANEVALIIAIASLKHEIREPSTAAELQQMKREILSHVYSLQVQTSQPNVPLPQLPEIIMPGFPPIDNLKNRIRIISPPFEKQITESDVSSIQSRISLNRAFVKKHYLPMLNGDEDLKKGIKVTTYGFDGQEFEMDFKIWAGDKYYVLNNGWQKFSEYYELKACTYWATIWMFRDKNTNRLCFAFTWKIDPSTTKLNSSRSKG